MSIDQCCRVHFIYWGNCAIFFYSTYSASDVDGGGEGDPDEYYGDGYESSEEVCSHIV